MKPRLIWAFAAAATLTLMPLAGAEAQGKRGNEPAFKSTLEDQRLARCEESVRRTFRRSRYYADMQFPPEANLNEPEEAKPRGKFTPRYPIDVELILKLPIEVLMKKENEWKEAELWCGLAGGKFVAGDIVEKRTKPVP